MSEHDVPAERDELREKLRHLTRDPGPLGSAVCALLKAAEAEFPVMVMPDESRAILDLLAPQGAPQTHEVAAESPSRGPDGSEVGSGLRRDCRAIAAPHEAPPILSRKHANEIAYFLRRPDMAHDAKRERLASLVERAGAAPQEAPICLQCIDRAEQDIAAGHYYRADELMAALRDRREPVCACGETHSDRTPLAAARPAPEARDPEVLVAALRAIVDMEPEPFDFPADWDQQVAACEECKRWKDHPIQQGICDTHRQPLWDRDAHVKSEQRRLHYRMRSVAREALDAYALAAAPAEATELSAPDGATWGDVRSGLRAELIAEGMPVTEATRLARKVVHRFTAAEATEEGAGEREQEECVWRAIPTGGWHSACGRNVLLLPVDSLCTCGRSICPDTSEEGADDAE